MNDSLPYLLALGSLNAYKRDGSFTANYLKHKARYPKLELTTETEDIEYLIGLSLILEVRLNELRNLLHSVGSRESSHQSQIKVEEEIQKRLTAESLSRASQEFVEESGIEEVRLIAQWMALQGRANAVGNWIDLYNDKTGCIHGNLWLASSLRYRHDKPNTANIPAVSDDEDGNPIKGVKAITRTKPETLWTHRPGNRKLVGVDAKAMQMRNLAHWLDDGNFTAAVLAKDPHSVNRDNWGLSSLMMPEEDLAKTLYYAIVMGAGDARVASAKLKSQSKEAKAAKKMVFDKVPGFPKLLEDA
jgi:hypothetical protein